MQRKLTISHQEKLLSRSLATEVPFSTLLKQNGLSYDDLVYRCYEPVRVGGAPYTTPVNYDFAYHGVPAVSFFSGAGGLDLGFKYAGFNNVAAFEIDSTFCETLIKNHQGYRVCKVDMRKREEVTHILASQLRIAPPFKGVFHGGPPCQPFSIASNQRYAKWQDEFKRTGFKCEDQGTLLFDFIWQIEIFRPTAFLLENVVGLMTIDNGEQWSRAVNILTEAGYQISRPMILNARHYGVPQSRIRAFVCGWSTNRARFIPPTEDLIEVPCHKALSKPMPNSDGHVTREHTASSILRYMELRYGQRDDPGRVDRLNPNLPAKTVIGGGTKGGGRSHLHPFIPRTLSPRESARLQTFPDEYLFYGPPARQFTQIGNSVPPLLAMKLALSIYKSFFA
jgi:DNA (cytosine-5)-methyltransferase 1